MSDIVEFLLARIAEDEAVARAATVAPWIPVDGTVQSPGVPVGMQGPWEHTSPVTRFTLDRDAAHIARFDPAWVLAEVEAKRQIVAEAREIVDDPEKDWGDVDSLDDHHVQAFAFTFRALASVYRDHPDFDPAWEV
jgi:hypothetical protein